MRLEHALLGATLFFLGTFAGHLYSGGQPFLTQQCLQGTVQAVFSPGAEDELVAFVGSARESMDIQLFQFSFGGLKEALVKAKERGVRVRLLLDSSVDSNLETAAFLKGKGIDVRWSPSKYAYAHAKYAIVDSRKVAVGSINWSYNGMHRNREAEVIVEEENVAKKFGEKFEEDWRESTAVVG